MSIYKDTSADTGLDNDVAKVTPAEDIHPPVKTVFIWDNMDGDIKFFVLRGDYSSFDGIYINTGGNDEEEQKKEDELNGLFYNDEGLLKHDVVMYPKFPVQEVLNGAIVITCGFIP